MWPAAWTAPGSRARYRYCSAVPPLLLLLLLPLLYCSAVIPPLIYPFHITITHSPLYFNCFLFILFLVHLFLIVYMFCTVSSRALKDAFNEIVLLLLLLLLLFSTPKLRPRDGTLERFQFHPAPSYSRNTPTRHAGCRALWRGGGFF